MPWQTVSIGLTIAAIIAILISAVFATSGHMESVMVELDELISDYENNVGFQPEGTVTKLEYNGGKKMYVYTPYNFDPVNNYYDVVFAYPCRSAHAKDWLYREISYYGTTVTGKDILDAGFASGVFRDNVIFVSLDSYDGSKQMAYDKEYMYQDLYSGYYAMKEYILDNYAQFNYCDMEWYIFGCSDGGVIANELGLQSGIDFKGVGNFSGLCPKLTEDEIMEITDELYYMSGAGVGDFERTQCQKAYNYMSNKTDATTEFILIDGHGHSWSTWLCLMYLFMLRI